eukprot:3922643-Rhodomonas_salina.1
MNTLIKALQTPEACSIVTVHNIIASELDNRHGFKEYRETGGRVITSEALEILTEKVDQLKRQNDYLSTQARDANTALAATKVQADAEINRLKTEAQDTNTALAANKEQADTKINELKTALAANKEQADAEIHRLKTEALTANTNPEKVGEKRPRALDTDDLCAQVAELRVDKAELRQLNAELKQANDELKQANSDLKQTNTNLTTDIDSRITQVTHASSADLLAERRKREHETKRCTVTTAKLRKASPVLRTIFRALATPDTTLRHVVRQNAHIIAEITHTHA